jgi:outer membrane protein
LLNAINLGGKMLKKLFLGLIPLMFAALVLQASDSSSSEEPAVALEQDKTAKVTSAPVKVAIVNFKSCVEKSKMGKKEQETFEAMKKQMENILGEKEKELTAMANKLADSDYLDSLSPEKETEMKRQFRAQSQELQQIQNQYLQTLQQANVKIIQKIAEVVAKASSVVAKEMQIDLVLNEDISFFHGDRLDISDSVTVVMDKFYEQELAAAKEATPEALSAKE